MKKHVDRVSVPVIRMIRWMKNTRKKKKRRLLQII